MTRVCMCMYVCMHADDFIFPYFCIDLNKYIFILPHNYIHIYIHTCAISPKKRAMGKISPNGPVEALRF